ncbi:MAG TPA: diphosphomevalonate decarboxylase [Coxiellaceae bacterium]|nr:diphosphomevalonate decarboxylase [Coxiellaceae bacterium]
MNAREAIQTLLSKKSTIPQKKIGEAFAPSNIALVKYWGKRDSELNLPVTDSLSVSLGAKGAKTKISVSPEKARKKDTVILNGQKVLEDSLFYQRISNFLAHFRFKNYFYHVETELNIPASAGLASSACGFAALVKALDDLYHWHCDSKTLSILSRLGSGSACRSVWQGFVHWKKGEDLAGMDSYGVPLADSWPELCIGLCIVESGPKSINSREAMQRTVQTSPLYATWPEQVKQDLQKMLRAIRNRDFQMLGETAEENAQSMHKTMHASCPPIEYDTAATHVLKQTIKELRKKDISLYFTQDAGPNLKLLFLEKNSATIQLYFPEMIIVQPFQS